MNMRFGKNEYAFCQKQTFFLSKQPLSVENDACF